MLPRTSRNRTPVSRFTPNDERCYLAVRQPTLVNAAHNSRHRKASQSRCLALITQTTTRRLFPVSILRAANALFPFCGHPVAMPCQRPFSIACDAVRIRGAHAEWVTGQRLSISTFSKYLSRFCLLSLLI